MWDEYEMWPFVISDVLPGMVNSGLEIIILRSHS
jgi:hypothetical protein